MDEDGEFITIAFIGELNREEKTQNDFLATLLGMRWDDIETISKKSTNMFDSDVMELGIIKTGYNDYEGESDIQVFYFKSAKLSEWASVVNQMDPANLEKKVPLIFDVEFPKGKQYAKIKGIYLQKCYAALTTAIFLTDRLIRKGIKLVPIVIDNGVAFFLWDWNLHKAFHLSLKEKLGDLFHQVKKIDENTKKELTDTILKDYPNLKKLTEKSEIFLISGEYLFNTHKEIYESMTYGTFALPYFQMVENELVRFLESIIKSHDITNEEKGRMNDPNGNLFHIFKWLENPDKNHLDLGKMEFFFRLFTGKMRTVEKYPWLCDLRNILSQKGIEPAIISKNLEEIRSVRNMAAHTELVFFDTVKECRVKILNLLNGLLKNQ
jgi:hypothetical protein